MRIKRKTKKWILYKKYRKEPEQNIKNYKILKN